MRIGLINALHSSHLHFLLKDTFEEVQKDQLTGEEANDNVLKLEIEISDPNTLHQKVSRNQLDIGFVSLRQCYKDGHSLDGFIDFVALAPFGVASTESVKSVLAFYPREWDISPPKSANFYLDPQSRTANQLFKVLHRKYNVLGGIKLNWIISKDRDENLSTSCDNSYGYLIIADPALFHTPPNGFCTLDLTQCWYSKTTLPFVYAIAFPSEEFKKQSYYKRSISLLQKAIILAQSRASESSSFKKYLAEKYMKFDIGFIQEYLNQFHYVLCEKDLDAIRKFLSENNALPAGDSNEQIRNSSI